MFERLFSSFRLLRSMMSIGPELRRLNRNLESYMQQSNMSVPLTPREERRLTAELKDEPAVVVVDEQEEYLKGMKERAMQGLPLDVEDVLRISKAVEDDYERDRSVW